MNKSRKRRIHKARNGTCWSCGAPELPVAGPGVIYEHRPPLAFLEEDVDERVYLSCRACADAITPLDISDIAKAKRIKRKNDPVQRKAPTMKGRGFRKHPTLKRGLNGKVKPR